MIYLSSLNSEQSPNIRDLVSSERVEKLPPYHPRSILTEEHFQDYLKYLAELNESDRESPHYWLTMAEAVAIWPERRQTLLGNQDHVSGLMRLMSRFINIGGKEDNSYLMLVAACRMLFPDEMKKIPEVLGANVDIWTRSYEHILKMIDDEKYGKVVQSLGLLKRVYQEITIKMLMRKINLESLLNYYEWHRDEETTLYFLSSVRILFPDTFKPTQTQLEAALAEYKEWQEAPVRTGDINNAFELGILACDQLVVDEQGLHMTFQSSTTKSGAEDPVPPRRNF